MNKEVVKALHQLERAVDHAEDASEDAAEMNIYSNLWFGIFNAVSVCAADLAHKKAVPGVTSTENGKGKSTISSVAESPGNVNTPPGPTAPKGRGNLKC